MPRKPVIFLHIPKTAGGTLRYVVTRQYKAHQTVEAYHRRQKNARYIDDLKMMNAAEKSEIQLVQGHTKFGAHQFFEKEMPYITVLREPVARILSFYYYVKKIPEHRLHQLIQKNNWGLKEFVENMDERNLNNGQAQLIAGKSEGEDILQTAKENLGNHFAAVGLTEKFDESLILFKQKLAWKNVRYRLRNVNQKKKTIKEVPEEVLEIIRQKNALDMELYEYGKKLFEAQLAEVKNLDDELNRMKSFNKKYEAYMGLRGTIGGWFIKPKKR